jgi:hypothetical protein
MEAIFFPQSHAAMRRAPAIALTQWRRRAAALCVLVISWSAVCHADVVVKEFPRDTKAADPKAPAESAPKTDGAAKGAAASPATAADFLAGLREASQRERTAHGTLAPPPDTTEIKLDLIPTKERKERTQLGYRMLRVPKNTYGVEGHGANWRVSLKNGEEVTPAELARWIKRDTRYVRDMPVYLLACETGKGDRPYAQELADILQTDVYAPTERLWIMTNGTYNIYASTSNKPADGTAQLDGTADHNRPGRMKYFRPTAGR